MRIPSNPPDPRIAIREHSEDLDKVLLDSKIRDFVQRCQGRYFTWDKVRLAAPPGVAPELAWAMIKFQRAQNKVLPLYGSNQRPLHFGMPASLQQELMCIDQELAGNLASDDENPLTHPQKERFILAAFREEAIASSMLEGAVTTWRDAKLMLKTGRKPRTRGEKMVANNYRGIQFIRENKKEALSPALLLELQKILTEGTVDSSDWAGRFRTDNDDIRVVDERDGTVMHVPPPALELEERITNLCAFANQEAREDDFLHPVIQACVIHFQLGFDHPFCDGNGRTARALFYWLMLRRGYWLFEFLPISRLIYRGPVKYARAYLNCEIDDFDVTYFLLYKAKIIKRARQELGDYIREKKKQVSQARQLFSADRRLNHRQREVVLRAAKHPDAIFTIAEHRSLHAIAYETARRDLIELATWGYLSQDEVGNRYEFHPTDKFSSV